MTNPIVADFEKIIPSKAKAWVGLLGSLLTFAVPYLIDSQQYLPSPWQFIIGFALAALTSLGILKTPYVPPGAVLVPTSAITPSASPTNPVTPASPPGGWDPTNPRNPWKG